MIVVEHTKDMRDVHHFLVRMHGEVVKREVPTSA
jgi:hypothetical protein